MKKKFTLLVCMIAILASCQKENQKTSVSSPALNKKHLSLAPMYTDMTLNSDGSYTAYWNSCLIRVTSPAWDLVKYPALVNGVPVLAGSLTTFDGTSSIDVVNSGFAGNVFQVTQVFMSLTSFDVDGFNSDLAKYDSAFNTWIDNGQTGTRPDITSYIKDSYTVTIGSGQIKTFTGKLIRVTTGSNLAIADLSYPIPADGSTPAGTFSARLNDAAYQTTYAIYGSKDLITSATIGSTSYPASGSYTTDSVGNITAIGTIIRSDGTKFNFNITYYD
ncbi:MAG: hypothetical protein ACTHNW_21900 [Mucilaginibacter sp.]